MGCILKLVSFLLFFNIFYIGHKKALCSAVQGKEELNEYAYELDRLVDKRTYELRQVNKRLMADLEGKGYSASHAAEVLPQMSLSHLFQGICRLKT